MGLGAALTIEAAQSTSHISYPTLNSETPVKGLRRVGPCKDRITGILPQDCTGTLRHTDPVPAVGIDHVIRYIGVRGPNDPDALSSVVADSVSHDTGGSGAFQEDPTPAVVLNDVRTGGRIGASGKPDMGKRAPVNGNPCQWVVLHRVVDDYSKTNFGHRDPDLSGLFDGIAVNGRLPSLKAYSISASGDREPFHCNPSPLNREGILVRIRAIDGRLLAAVQRDPIFSLRNGYIFFTGARYQNGVLRTGRVDGML